MASRRSWRSIVPNTKHSARRIPRRVKQVVSLETARARRTPIEWRAADLPVPSFTGVRVLDKFPLATLRDFIDWTPFFHTWGLKGVYPRILEHESRVRRRARFSLKPMLCWIRIIEKKLITARGVYGFFPG